VNPNSDKIKRERHKGAQELSKKIKRPIFATLKTYL
jgi:hypothetical protein